MLHENFLFNHSILRIILCMELNEMPASAAETEERLLDALASLNQIGAAVNRLGQADQVDTLATLKLIVESAIKVIPGAAAVIYIYDPVALAFDSASRVSAGDWMAPSPGIEPRLNGMGSRAIEQRRGVISYEEPDLQIHPLMSASGAMTAACFPLVVNDQPVGVLYVYLNDIRRFSQLERLMLENFVNHAAMAIYQDQRLVAVQKDLARKNEELEHLRRAGLLISSRLRLEDTLEAILQMALDLTHARYGIFRLLDKDGENLVTRAIAGDQLARPRIETLPVRSNSIMGWVARHRLPACIADLHASEWANLYYPLDSDLEMCAELAVPLISASGRLEGVLNLESPVVGAFTEQDSHLLQSLATQAVIAIQEVRLLDALQEVAQMLLTETSRQVLQRLAELARDLLNVDYSVIWTYENGKLYLQSSSGSLPAEERAELHILPRQAVQTRSMVTGTLTASRGESNQAVNALVVPLLTSSDREPLGAFGIYSGSQETGHFTESDWDKKVLASLAHYAALAVRNAFHQEALRTAQEQRAVAETFAVVGDIAANLLHQLNNKVGTIPVRIQGIQDKCHVALSSDRYLDTNLKEIERSANEAMEAVRENLSNLRPIHLSEVSVAACVQAAIETASLPDSVQVYLEGLESLPVVVAGSRTLTLVFTNLLGNASDAMRGDGTIEIHGLVRQSWVEVTVSDTGPGIAADLHDRIFELNYSGRTSARTGKLGFGLWWVRTLMARLGGSVAVESDGIHGATFRLRLPIAGGKL
jgi:signal transduction histidine kinase/putative methionine-R-sulfoxide reductase with GAF domain